MVRRSSGQADERGLRLTTFSHDVADRNDAPLHPPCRHPAVNVDRAGKRARARRDGAPVLDVPAVLSSVAAGSSIAMGCVALSAGLARFFLPLSLPTIAADRLRSATFVPGMPR